MQEDRAAGAGHHRVVILAQNNDHVIKVIVAPHFLVAGGKGKLDEAIVVGVIGGVAPAVLPTDGRAGEGFGRRAVEPVGPIEYPPDRPAADRADAVALAYLRRNAAAPHGAAPRLVAIGGS